MNYHPYRNCHLQLGFGRAEIFMHVFYKSKNIMLNEKGEIEELQALEEMTRIFNCKINSEPKRKSFPIGSHLSSQWPSVIWQEN